MLDIFEDMYNIIEEFYSEADKFIEKLKKEGE